LTHSVDIQCSLC